MVATAGDFDNAVLFKCCDSLGLLNTFEIAMTQLAPMLLNRGTTPGVQISVLVNRCKVMLTGLNLHGHQAVQGRNKLGLMVMSARHLENLLVLQQAERCVVVAGDLPHPVARQGVLQLEL